jgi:hypothetical protein
MGSNGAIVNHHIREMLVFLGRKGAALTALGEMVGTFFVAGEAAPLEERLDGVKLGESTLKRFLLLSD